MSLKASISIVLFPVDVVISDPFATDLIKQFVKSGVPLVPSQRFHPEGGVNDSHIAIIPI